MVSKIRISDIANITDNRGDINAIAPNGLVSISDVMACDVVDLLGGAALISGGFVAAYPANMELGAYVPPFVPADLGEDTYRQLRSIIEDFSDQALAMFDLIVERKLQISFAGADYIDAYMKGEPIVHNYARLQAV